MARDMYVHTLLKLTYNRISTTKVHIMQMDVELCTTWFVVVEAL